MTSSIPAHFLAFTLRTRMKRSFGSITDYFRPENPPEPAAEAEIGSEKAPLWGKLVQEADLKLAKRRASVKAGAEEAALLAGYMPDYEPVFQDCRAPGLGLWRRAHHSLVFPYIAGKAEPEDGEWHAHRRSPEVLQKNLAFLLRTALEMLHCYFTDAEQATLQEFLQLEASVTVHMLSQSLWFRCPADQLPEGLPMLRNLRDVDANLLFVEIEQMLEFVSKESVLNVWKRMIRQNGGNVAGNKTKKEAVAAIMEFISRRIPRKGVQVALQPFREAMATSSEGQTLYRWEQRAAAIVRKAVGTVFMAGGIEPEEAVALWNVDMQQLRFASHSPSLEPGLLVASSPLRLFFNIAELVHFLNEIFAVLVVADAMEQAVRRADCDQAYKIMHEAASHLIVVGALEARTDQPELYLLGLVYTAWISRTLFRGVCLLEREKQYAEAIHYLTVLLETPCLKHCPSRGRWWQRLAMDLQHNNQADAAIAACEKALAEADVCAAGAAIGEAPACAGLTGGQRLALENQLVKLCVPPRRWRAPKLPPRREVPWREITVGKDELERTYLERLVLNHALASQPDAEQWEGEHAENSIILTLFVVLFWDVLYPSWSDDVGSTLGPTHHGFLASYQLLPLDLRHSSALSPQRLQAAEELTANVRAGRVQSAMLIRENHRKHFGKLAVGIDWERFDVEDTLIPCAVGFGDEFLLAACNKLLRCFEVWSHGFPDLLLWRKSDDAVGRPAAVKCIEVKGPTDSLSPQQIAWIQLLMDHNIDVHVLRVWIK